MVNCSCSRFHKPVTVSIDEARLQIPYPNISEENVTTIKNSVISLKQGSWDEAAKKIKNLDIQLAKNQQNFETKFTSSKSFHKLVEQREKIEVQLEKMRIDDRVEKLYPETAVGSVVVNGYGDDFEYTRRVEDEHGNGVTYYLDYKYNKITGRSSPRDLYQFELIQLQNKFIKIIEKELKSTLSEESDDCVIS